MIKLNTAKNAMGDAWMLKHDGTAIPIDVHIYGAEGDLETNVEAALWMMKYSPYDKLKQFLAAYVGYVAANEVPFTEDDSQFRDNLREALQDQVWEPSPKVVDYLMNLVSGMSIDDIYDAGDNIDDNSGDFVAKDLNEMFIRVRMNDEYNRAAYNGVGYFRIGSTYKDWTNPIYAFVADHPKIKTIVVERDVESDNEAGSNQRRVMIDNMSRDEFLSATKLPFLGSKQTGGLKGVCYGILSSGSYTDLNSVRANRDRINRAVNYLKQENLKQNYTRVEAPWATTPQNR